MGPQIPQATIDKLTDQIIANILPVLKSSVSQAVANALADAQPTSAPNPTPIPDPSVVGLPVGKPNIGNAQWIWADEKAFPYRTPTGLCAFRQAHYYFPEFNDSMVIDITCNNWYTLYVNGNVVGNGTAWNVVKRYSIKFPRTHRLDIAVYAANDPARPLPPALIASAVVWDSTDLSGRTTDINENSYWKATTTADPSGFTGFEQPSYKFAHNWNYVIVQGSYGKEPWGAIKKPTAISPVTGGFSGVRGIPDPPAAPLATPGPGTGYGPIGPNPLAQLDGAD